MKTSEWRNIMNSALLLMIFWLAVGSPLSIDLAGPRDREITVDQCPLILIRQVPSRDHSPGKYSFAVDITGGLADKQPTYVWKISAGEIVSGQNTGEVAIDITGCKSHQIEIKVEVGKIIPDGCSNDSTYTFTVLAKVPQ
jgi:hypothetical protein